MMPWPDLWLYMVACVLLVLTPGPNLLYLISRTLCQGRAAGVVSLAGTTTGFLVHIVAAALGLSVVFVTIPVALRRRALGGRRVPALSRVGRGAAARRRRPVRRAATCRRVSPAGRSIAPGSSPASSTRRSRCSTSRCSRSSSTRRAAACWRSRCCSGAIADRDRRRRRPPVRARRRAGRALARGPPGVGGGAALGARRRVRGDRREARARRAAMNRAGRTETQACC